MALFDGLQNFSPALEGQRIAIGAGQGAGASISRGMRTAQEGRQVDFNLNGDKELLDTMTGRLKARLTQSSGDWLGEAGPPMMFQ